MPDCRQKNLTYRTVCRLCKQKGTHSTYVGETSRSLHERQKEHAQDSRLRKESSHMHQHLWEKHQDVWEDLNLEDEGWRQYKIEVIKTHQSSFTRQIHEAVAMMIEPGTILNDKSEYNRCLIPSLEVKGAWTESQTSAQARADRQAAAERQQEATDTLMDQTRAKRHNPEQKDKEQHSTHPEKRR